MAADKNCQWYQVRSGDTLGHIGERYSITVERLAQTNAIRNVNIIFVGQRLCIPQGKDEASSNVSGLQANGEVRWHARDALEHTTQEQVASLIRQTAARYNLPANLLLAIAWQESGWTQHVIARDGGIGAMQVMPYTAGGLNQQVGQRYDPYKLAGNVELGAIFLQSLWHTFPGDLDKVISAYNQGAWGVQHRGIQNWSYVKNVRALMERY